MERAKQRAEAGRPAGFKVFTKSKKQTNHTEAK